MLNQKQLTHWYRIASPQRHELARLRQAHPALDHRLAHLSPVQYKQPHQPLDIPAKVVVQHKPNAFLKTMLPNNTEGLSKYQMSLYLKLLHGLPLPSPNTNQGICSCGCLQDALGYHRLNCKKHTGTEYFVPLSSSVIIHRNTSKLRFEVCDNQHPAAEYD